CSGSHDHMGLRDTSKIGQNPLGLSAFRKCNHHHLRACCMCLVQDCGMGCIALHRMYATLDGQIGELWIFLHHHAAHLRALCGQGHIPPIEPETDDHQMV